MVLDRYVDNSTFEIVSDWAYPQSTNAMNSVAAAGLVPPGSIPGQISLIGNANYIRVFKDSVDIYLPYFGERQINGGYGKSDNSIQYQGVPEDMQINWNEKKKRYDIQFSFKQGAERFNANGQLFPNLQSSLTLTSSFRFPIRYKGIIKASSQLP